MIAYIIRRLLYTLPIVFGVLLLTFCLFSVAGGDISIELAGKGADAETIAEIRHEYGLDKPLFLGLEKLDDDELEVPDDPNVLLQYVENRPDSIDTELSPSDLFYAKENAKKELLKDLFWKRIKDGQIGQGWKMLDFDSQFASHFKNALVFDFGRARDRELVIDKFKRGVGPSLALTVPMFFGTIFISVALALMVAFVRGSKLDIFVVLLCVAGMSIPYLSFIMFGQFFFAYKLGWFPLFFSPELNIGQCVMLPVLIGIIAGLGGNLRFYRTVMLDDMRSDYVRTAFAKGLTTRKVLFKHVLKNAMIPIITRVVLAIPYLILGSLLQERFFGIPGLGYLMVEAIGSRDFFVINAMTYLSALLFVIFHLLTDICYAFVDPRVSFD
jgi:peptide/nickel transport system permease protein